MRPEITFYIVIAAITLFLLGGLFMAFNSDSKCMKACGSDPVARCYPDRATCAGMEKQYMVPVP